MDMIDDDDERPYIFAFSGARKNLSSSRPLIIIIGPSRSYYYMIVWNT